MDSLKQLSDLLDAVQTGINVAKRVGELPGVSSLPYVAAATSALAVASQLLKAGRDIEPQITAIVETFSNPTVSEADMAALDAEIVTWSAMVDAPLPEKEAGEQD